MDYTQQPQYPNRSPMGEDMSTVKKLSLALPIAIVCAVGIVVAGALWLMNEAGGLQGRSGTVENLDTADKLQVLNSLYSDGASTPIEEKEAVLKEVSASGSSDISTEEKLELLNSLQ